MRKTAVLAGVRSIRLSFTYERMDGDGRLEQPVPIANSSIAAITSPAPWDATRSYGLPLRKIGPHSASAHWRDHPARRQTSGRRGKYTPRKPNLLLIAIGTIGAFAIRWYMKVSNMGKAEQQVEVEVAVTHKVFLRITRLGR